MKRKLKLCQLPAYLFLAAAPMLAILALSSCGRVDRTKYTAHGVSKLLATYRYETLKDVRYNLTFRIDTGRNSPVEGTAVIEFERTSGREPLLIDFNVPADHFRSVSVNGRQAEAALTNGHIVIDRSLLSKSYNRVEVGFRAGDLSLNRNDAYLYTLFVPDRASTAFPCFDQPDIKGRFKLALDIPESYRAMSNNPVVSADTASGRVTLRFSETRPISTYLFAFAAGKFDLIEQEINGVKMEMLHRETREGYVENNAEEIFRLHYSALKWLEEYTQIPYPFDKFGFVLIPSFQYSGMEHPGSILYRASSLMLEASPTLNEQLSRASLIAHETSHIWFGDLVTMKWFDDVWLKEVFAGYMSDKIVTPDFPTVNHDLRFLLSRYPAAYAVDRTRGTNPVIQELDNMKDAGSLYGAIIYNKAPIVMRQLEQLAGEDKLREALRIYLKEYAWGNARWDDLISVMKKVTRKPLEEWSRMWVREAGMPIITPVVNREKDGMKEVGTDQTVTEKAVTDQTVTEKAVTDQTVTEKAVTDQTVTEKVVTDQTVTHPAVTAQSYRISFREDDPAGVLRHWPQTLQTMVITSSDTVTAEVIPADRRSFLAAGGEPLCIIPDISGRAYGTFLFDSTTASYLPEHINDFHDPLLRGILWINMHENLLNGTVSPTVYYDALFSALQKEEELQLRNYLAGRMAYVYWHHLSDSARAGIAPDAEAMIWHKLVAAETASEKRQWFVLFRNVAVTERGLARLRDLWKSGELPGGEVPNKPGSGPVRLGEDEQSGLALTLALRNHPEAPAVIAAQRGRIVSPDRLQRFDFVLPSVSPDQDIRDEFFNSLRDPSNREHEPWVLEALGYLHHPSVANRSQHYILPSLELLEEIKSTGDIFFPGGWITTTLAGHHSAEACETVEKFLDDNPGYPADLKLKILQAADHLFREQRGER